MSSGHSVSDQRTVYFHYCGHGNPDYLGELFTKTWSGTNQASGEPLADHPYSMTIENRVSHLIQWKSHWAENLIAYYGHDSPEPLRSGSLGQCFGQSGVFVAAPWDSNDELKLINKLASKIRGSDFNAGNFLGESHQTLALISDTATRIAKMLNYIRDGNFYAATKVLGISRRKGHVLQNRYGGRFGGNIALRDFSDAVLELRYGWQPLLGDVHSSMHTLAKRLETPWRSRYRARRKITYNDTHNGYNNLILWRVKSTREVNLIVTLESPPSLSTQLHLNDPLSVAWEILPWSFVADWFIPIQDYLGAVDFYRRFEIKQMLRSDKEVKSCMSLGGHPPISPNHGYYEIVGEADHHKLVTFNRTIESPQNYFWMPTPTLRGLDKALSPVHLQNAFALLNGTVDGIRKRLKF